MTYDELVRGINDRLSEGKYHQDFAGKSGVQLEELMHGHIGRDRVSGIPGFLC